ncbi:hypothetical protein K8Q93_02150 [Candidatus Parcubacteria bacterium]|nr:hypothetical protein [Candidatus Parcubacteria bacterium]
MLSAGTAKSREEAENLVDAFLQWMSLVPAVRPPKVYVMLKTPVDDVFHAFLEHEGPYRDFCSRYLGFEVKHHPIKDPGGIDLPQSARFSVGLLERHFGAELHPILKDWRNQLDGECYAVSCIVCPETSEMGQTVQATLPNGATIMH